MTPDLFAELDRVTERCPTVPLIFFMPGAVQWLQRPPPFKSDTCSEDFLHLFLTFRPGVGTLWPTGTPVIGTPIHFIHLRIVLVLRWQR